MTTTFMSLHRTISQLSTLRPVRQASQADEQGPISQRHPSQLRRTRRFSKARCSAQDNQWVEMSGQRQSPVDEGNHGIGRQLWLPEWSETSHGRKMLAHEQERLRDHAFTGIRLSVMQGRLVAKGSIGTDKGSAMISLLYPSTPDRQDGLLKIATTAQPEIQATVPGELSEGLEQAAAVVSEFLQFAHSIRRTGNLGSHHEEIPWPAMSGSDESSAAIAKARADSREAWAPGVSERPSWVRTCATSGIVRAMDSSASHHGPLIHSADSRGGARIRWAACVRNRDHR